MLPTRTNPDAKIATVMERQAAREISPLSLLRMVWKHRIGILLIWAGFVALSIAVIYRLPTLYRAEALILVDSQKIPDKYVSATVNTELQDQLATVKQRVLSTSRLQKVIDTFGLYPEARAKQAQEDVFELMRSDVKVQIERGWTMGRPGAFRVSYQAPSARLAADVANQVANLFISENLRSRESHAEGTSEFLNDQLEKVKRALDEQEARVSTYKVQHNGELPQQENSLVGTLARLQVELQGNQDAINRAQQHKVMVETSLLATEASAAAAERALQASRAIRTASRGPAPLQSTDSTEALPRRASETLQARYEALKLRYSDEHPEMKRLKLELEAAREEEAHATAPAPRVPSAPSPARAAAPVQSEAPANASLDVMHERERVAEIKAQAMLAGRELESLSTDRQRILREIGACQARLQRLPIREQEMAALLRDYEISKTNYRSLLDKKMAAEMGVEMERRQQAERFTLLELARVPERPFKPNRQVLMALAFLLGGALAFGVAVARELKRNLLLGEWELPPDMVVLGRIPLIAAPAAPPSGRNWRFPLRGLL